MPGLIYSAKQKARGLLDQVDEGAENLSIGLGYGITDQLEGLLGTIQHPINTAKGMYESGKAIVKDPSLLGDIASGMYQNASSGLLGAGEEIGRLLPLGPPRNPKGLLEMTAYHGSPHKFDQFDLAKVGTGEGAQAYGHGIYVAESPGVAKTYQAMHARKGFIAPNGKEYSFVEPSARTALRDLGFDDDAIDGALLAMQSSNDMDFAKAAVGIERAVSRFPPGAIDKRILEQQLEIMRRSSPAKGHLYTVDLPDEHIAKMLDWDKPLSQQPPSVQKALADVGPPELTDGMALAGGGNLKVRNSVDGSASYYLSMGGKDFRLSAADVQNLVGTGVEGKSAYQALSTKLGGDAAASKWLRERGIPGIKYFDGNSRAAGEGTRNFVIFDPNLAKILKRE